MTRLVNDPEQLAADAVAGFAAAHPDHVVAVHDESVALDDVHRGRES